MRLSKEQLGSAPIPLIQYGVQEAFYNEGKTVVYARSEKAVKLFYIFDGKRINFWMPKTLLVFVDGKYSHIKYFALKFMRKNIVEAAGKLGQQISFDI